MSPELASESRKIIRGKKLNFDILFDQNNQLAEKFGLAFRLPDSLIELYTSFGIDLAKTQGNDNWRLPIPARYVIKSDGQIASVDFNLDYTQRPEPEETLEVLKKLS